MRPAAACALAVALAVAPGVGRPDGPTRSADHVFIIMMDGARPDVLRRAHVPEIQALAASGVTYLQARTVYPSQTRVAFVTLPTGAYPGSHGIVGGGEMKDPSWQTVSLGQEEDPVPAQALVARPTVFEETAAAGLTSLYAAMKGYELVGARGATWTINGKKTLDPAAREARYLADVGGSADLAAGYKQLLSRQLLDQVLGILREKRPNLVVVNLGSADYAGHSFGPSSPRYQQAIEHIDGLVGELVRAVEELGLRARTAFVLSADHGFSDVDARRVVAPRSDEGGRRLAALTGRGIEHFVTNTGGTSMGVYVREKGRLPEAVAILRKEPWCEAVYCEVGHARCDRTLRELKAYFADRSPDLMVDLDDDAALTNPMPGQHGSLREIDMRIPLILSGAGVAQGRVLGKAGLVDVAPTVLRLLGIAPKLLRPDGQVLEDALAR